MRALYIADWDPDEEKVPFYSIEVMNEEVKILRPDHNFATETAIKEVAKALRKNIDEKVFDSILQKLSIEAQNFWNINK